MSASHDLTDFVEAFDGKFLGFAPRTQFVEDAHPRGPHGEFIDKTIIRPTQALEATSAYHIALRRPAYMRETSTHGDSFMYDLAQDIGFGKEATVTDDAGLNKMVADGATELFRGFSDKSYAEGFLHGPYYAGGGFRGNGIYAAGGDGAETKAVAYAQAPPPHGIANKSDLPAVVRLALKPQAKIGDWARVKSQAEDESLRLKQLLASPDLDPQKRKRAEIAYRIALDPGRFAMVDGFDALNVGNGEYIILNRTALAASENIQSFRKPGQ